jgi:hypothetical protein
MVDSQSPVFTFRGCNLAPPDGAPGLLWLLFCPEIVSHTAARTVKAAKILVRDFIVPPERLLVVGTRPFFAETADQVNGNGC